MHLRECCGFPLPAHLPMGHHRDLQAESHASILSSRGRGGFIYGSCDEADELRIVLVGSAGTGKSATGNSILGEKKFLAMASPTSVTMECEKGVCVWKGKHLVVVDTPGFLNKKIYQVQVKECVKLCAPGPHAIVMVLQTGRFCQEEAESVDTIQQVLGRAAVEHMVVVFTRKEDLGQRLIEEFVSEAEPKLREFIAKCGGRFCAVNNRATGEENTRQVEELIQIMEEMKKKRGHFRIDAAPSGVGAVLKPLCNRGMAVGTGLGLAVGVAVAVGAGAPFAFMVFLMPVGLGVVGGAGYDLYKKVRIA